VIDAGAVNAALFGLLSGDGALRGLGQSGVYDTQVPEGTTPAYPYTIFQYQGEAPEHTQTEEAAVAFRYLVKHIDRAPSAVRVGNMGARVKTLLSRQLIPVAGTQGALCRRENGVRYVETAQGVVYQHAGGIYRIVVNS